jgi:hypothetical protein
MVDNIKKVIEDDGTIRYYLGDLHHNPEGPAVIGFAGRHKEYWIKGLRHRIDGPAIEYLDGDYEYWEEGRLHNLQGPAKCIDGVVEYWIDGRKYANEDEYIMKLFEMGYVNGNALIVGKAKSYNVLKIRI